MRLLSILLVCLLALILLLTVLMVTPAGLHAGIWTAKRLLPGELSISQAEGRLLDSIRIEHLGYQHEELAVNITDFRLDWRPSALLQRRLHVRVLSADRLDINLPPAEEEEESMPSWSDISLPLSFRLGQLDIGRLQLKMDNGGQTYESVRISAHTQADTFFIDSFSLGGHIGDTDFSLQAAGRIQLTRPWQHNLESGFALSHPGQPAVNGRLHSQGDSHQLTLTATTTAPAPSSLSLKARDLLQTPDWEAAVKIDQADLGPWLDSATALSADLEASGTGRSLRGRLQLALAGEMEQILNAQTVIQIGQGRQLQIESLSLHNPTQSLKLGLNGVLDYSEALDFDINGDWSLEQPHEIHGKLAVKGTPTDYSINLSAAAEQPFELQARLNGRGNTHSLTVEKLDAAMLEGKFMARGRFDWQDALSASLRGNWQNIAIPGAEAGLASPRGALQVEGTVTDYRISTTGRLHSPHLPAVDWQARLSGNPERLQIRQLGLALLEGEITATGEAQWTGPLQIRSDIRVHDINPGSYWQAWPGNINGRSRLILQPAGDTWLAAVKDLQLQGELRGYPLRVNGNLRLQDDVYYMQKVRVEIAESQLHTDGRLGQDSDLNWQFRSPDVGQLLPEAAGSLQAEGTLQGDYMQPLLKATATAKQLQTPWLQLAGLDASLNIQSAEDLFRADITASGLQLDQQHIERLDIQADGQLSRHNLKTAIQAGKRRLDLAGSGSWRDRAWSLHLDKGDFSGPLFGAWQLHPPLQVTVQPDSVRAPEHCWRQQPAELCLAADWQADRDWTGRISLQDYAFKQESPESDMDGPQLSGKLNGAIEISGNEQLLQQVRGQFRLSELLLRPDDETELRLNQLTANLSGDQQGVSLDIDGEFADPAPGSLKGRLQTGTLEFEQWASVPLEGSLTANISDLQPWLALYPRLTTEQARLDTKFAVDGRLGAPRLDGEMTLSASGVGLPELGIDMQTLEFRLSGQPQSGLELTARARSGPGDLTVNGRVRLENGGLLMPALRIKGQRFELLNLPEAWVLASPDLELSYTDSLLRVNGKVSIPEALLQPLDAPDTIAVSEDEVIVNQQQEQAPASPWRTQARIRLELGDAVRVTGGGFEGRLVGNLDIHQDPGKAARAIGELRIVDSEYSAYGQQLKIEAGKIIFTNHPIENPALEAKAVRNIDSVTAGIRVTGTAEQPVAELFSTPTMPEAEILSYLMLGRPLSEASSGDSDILLKAATSMGIKKTESIRQKIADVLGVDTLGVDTGTTSAGEADTRLVIGKYLAPNLYLSYGAGLVETAADTVKLRYEINRHLSLEATQGTGTGVDLLYQIESGDWQDKLK